MLFRRGEGQRTIDTSLKGSASFSVGFQMPLTCFVLGIRSDFRVDFFGPCVSQRTDEQAALGGAEGRGFWDPAGVYDKVFPIFTVPEYGARYPTLSSHLPRAFCTTVVSGLSGILDSVGGCWRQDVSAVR